MKKVLESESFKIFYDEKDEQLAKKSEGHLVENLGGLLDFFKVEKLAGAICVDFYSSLEEWKSYIESLGQQYQDYIVGIAAEGKISVLSYDEYKKTQMHKNRPFEDFLQIIVHECVHICNFARVENPDQSVCFIMEGLATYLSGQDYNPNVRADYDCQTMCNYQTFFELEDPYSVAQVYVRRMLEKLSREEVIEYSGNLEKLWNDWAKIF